MIDLQSELGIDVPAVVAGAVRELGVAALWTADVVNGLQRLVRAALALARLANALNRKHDQPRLNSELKQRCGGKNPPPYWGRYVIG